MIKLLFRSQRLFAQFKLNNYTNQDFATMCGLLQEKYQLHNQEIQTSGLIKLLDNSGRVIGVYTASEARKKAENLGLDMVMVSLKTSPVVCKVADFRKKTINRFYDEIVLRSQKQNQSKASSIKNVKISASLNKMQSTVKMKQIIELSQKYSKIRVFMMVKLSNKEESLSKLQELKSNLLGKCYIEEQISNRRFEEKDQQNDSEENKFDTFSFVVRAKDSDKSKITVSKKHSDPDSLTINFLQKYYTQEDGEMMDLKSSGFFITDRGEDAQQVEVKQLQQGIDIDGPIEKEDSAFDQSVYKEIEARVLNKRLKVLLSLSL